ncbi:SLAC1 anion channel family protein [Cupriavidus sp. 2TAF22]|uniref:SLAC1 anion channel family protein n=1 Tax=unclassified Cupriavidus TaxID=2640874 RepID=UPI003F8F63F6
MQALQPPAKHAIEKREMSVKHLPVNLFASVMGISGLSLAWRLAANQYGVSPIISGVIGLLAVIAFLILAVSYAVKIAKYPDAVMHEFRHPIAGNFFGTVPIAVLLISSIIGQASQATAEVVWTIGAIGTIALAFTIVSRLFRGKIDSGHALPAWLIPGVATLDIAVAGGTMSMPWAHEFNIFSLAVGTILALVFFTMIVSRLIHHEKLASGMIPSLMILIAPFEVGFLAYTNFTQRVDVFAAVLFYFGLFLFFTLVFKVFRRSIPFAAGWWGVSFPVAALTSAALKYADTVRVWPLTVLAILLLAFLSVVIVVLFLRTMRIVFSGDLLSGG